MDDAYLKQLEEMSLIKLQEEAVNLGMDKNDVRLFTVRAPIIAAIKAMKTIKGTAVIDVETPQEKESTEKNWKSKAKIMEERLNTQPKVRILVPLEGKEKRGDVRMVKNSKTGEMEQAHFGGAIQSVILNGYKYLVPKGIYVEVPQQVADQIQEKYQQTSEAGKQFLIDRVDPQTGKSVRDQLS